MDSRDELHELAEKIGVEEALEHLRGVAASKVEDEVRQRQAAEHAVEEPASE